MEFVSLGCGLRYVLLGWLHLKHHILDIAACRLLIQMFVGLVVCLYLLVAYRYGGILRIAERHHYELYISSVVVPLHLLRKHQRIGIVALGKEGAVFCIELLGVDGSLEVVPEIQHVSARIAFHALGKLPEYIEGEIAALITEYLGNHWRHHVTGGEVEKFCIPDIDTCRLSIVVEHILVYQRLPYGIPYHLLLLLAVYGTAGQHFIDSGEFLDIFLEFVV